MDIGEKCGKLRFEWGLELVEKKFKKHLQNIKYLIINKLINFSKTVQYKFNNIERNFLKVHKTGAVFY